MISPYCSMSLPDHCIVLQVGRIFRTRVCEYHGIHIPNCGIVRTYRDTCNTRVVPYQGKVIRYCSMGRHVSLSRACSVRYYHGLLLTIYSIRIAYYGFHIIYQGITRHVSLLSVISRYTCQNYYGFEVLYHGVMYRYRGIGVYNRSIREHVSTCPFHGKFPGCWDNRQLRFRSTVLRF